ncbi:MAG: hypothetical protein J0M15_00560 [Deltaproteobacteria bacterium]|jgi:hypothetical protein|nr:hypothetical protein [Deltaproteobacteria bacterium]
MMYLLSILVSLHLFHTAWASLDSTASHLSASSSALGGAGRAAVGPGDVSTLNPASLVYLFGFNFYTRYAPGETAISISDNTMETVIPAAVYVYQKLDFKNFKLSFAEPFSKRISLGMSLGYSQARVGEAMFNLANLDLGMTYLVSQNKAIGVVLYDLNKSPDNWPLENRVEPKIGVGYHYVYKGFLRARVDYLSEGRFKLNEGSLMFGVENYLNRWTLLRLGYQKNSLNINDLMTIGMGFDLPKFKINYAYLSDSKDYTQVRHSVDLMVPF